MEEQTQASILEIKANLKTDDQSILIQDADGNSINLLTDQTAIVPGIEYVAEHDFYILYDQPAFDQAGYRFATKSGDSVMVETYDHQAQADIVYQLNGSQTGEPFRLHDQTIELNEQMVEPIKNEHYAFTQEVTMTETPANSSSQPSSMLLIIVILIIVGLVALRAKR